MNRRTALLVCLAACLLLVSGLASAGPTKSIATGEIDSFVNAMKIDAGRTYYATEAQFATFETGEPYGDCASNGQPSVWFKFKADRAIEVTFSTHGSYLNYSEAYASKRQDTILSVIVSVNPGEPVFNQLATAACNDDAYDGVRHSVVSLPVSPGIWYFVRIQPFMGMPIPAGSHFTLEAQASDLTAHDSWSLKGSGKADDTMNCASVSCEITFAQSALGASKSVQIIDTFKGVKLLKGSTLELSGAIELTGPEHHYAFKLIIAYTDGTVVSKKAKPDALPERLSAGVALTTGPIELTKPVASIKVQFAAKSTAGGILVLKEPRLTHTAAAIAAKSAALLPLPQAPE